MMILDSDQKQKLDSEFLIFINRYQILINREIRRYLGDLTNWEEPGTLYNEMVAELYIMYYKGLRRRRIKNCSAYLKAALINHLRSERYRRNRLQIRRLFLESVVAGSEENKTFVDILEAEPAYDPVRQFCAKEIKITLFRELDDLGRKIVQCKLNPSKELIRSLKNPKKKEVSFGDIARFLEVSEDKVWNRLKKVREIFRAYGVEGISQRTFKKRWGSG